MNLVNELIKDLLPEEENKKTTALYAGGFKPPTSGHFEVVQQALKENPEIDEFIIFIGAKERDGISQDESLLIWEIYNNYLPFKVKLEPTSVPPIKAVYDFAKNHPTREVLWVIGAREGNEEDFKDINMRTSSISKYPNLELRTIVTVGGVSGTAARNASKISFEKFEKFIPSILSPEEKQEVYSLVSGKIQEIGDLSQQPYSWEFLPNNSDRSTKVYRFEAKDGIQYEVNLYYIGSYAGVDGRFEKGDWSLEFLAKAPGIGGYSSKALTGGGEPLKIMSTVVDITKDFIKDNGNVGRIVYTPTEGKTGERDAKDNIRGKLYKAIIQKSFPKAKISGSDNTAIIVDVSAYSTTELQEVGEANVSPYKWKERHRNAYSISYKFTTDSGIHYLVKFTDNDDDEDIDSLEQIRDWDISFFSRSQVDSDGAYSYSSSKVVNKGELFKVMSTIVDITKNVIKQFPNTEKLSFQPSPSKGDDTVDNQRGRLYKAFISKQLPQAKVDQEGSTITITLPKNSPQELSESDPKKGTGKKPKGSSRRLYTDEDPKDTVGVKFSTRQDIVDTLNKKSFKVKSHSRQSQIINLIHQRTRAAYNRAKKPDVKKRLKTALDYITKRKEASKKKTQRLKKQKNENIVLNHKGKAAPYGSGYKKLNEIKYTNPNFDEEWKEAERYPEFVKMGKEEWVKLAKQGKSVHYSSIKKVLGNVDLDFDNLEEPKKQRFTSAFKDGNIETPIAVKFSDNDYDLVAGNTRLAGSVKNGVDPKIWVVDLSKQTLNENASYSQHIDVKQRIKELTKHMLDKGMNIQPLPKVIFKHGDAKNAKQFLGKTAYYDPNNQSIVLYTEGRHPKDIVRSYSHEMIHHIQNLEGRLGNINTTNTLEDDHLDKLEQEANLGGTMTFRNWTDSLTEGKKKDPFGLNAYAAELARLREDKENIKVYLDMDGVLADFNQRFKDLSGMEPNEFESKYGKNEFWDFIDEKHKVGFWVGIPAMNGAKQLVDWASKYDYSILTAPSLKKQSILGKSLWVKKHTGDLFPSKPNVIFKQAKNKHLVKPELQKTDILIDDKQSTIDNWNAAGGTGIFYKNISQVLNDLGKLDL